MRIFIVLFLLFTIPGIVRAQFQFDVKTKLSEKHGLQIIKAGLIHSINESSWASVTDVGEDYSLWITSLRREIVGDSMQVVVRIELRTKAMFTRGKFINGTDVGIQYHWEKSMVYARDSVKVTFNSPDRSKHIEESAYTLRSLIGVAAGLDFGITSTLLQITSEKASKAVGNIASTLKKKPSQVEVIESLLIADQTLQAIKGMLK